MNIAIIIPSLANKGPIKVVSEIEKNIDTGAHSIKIFYFDELLDIEMKSECQKIDFFKKIEFDDFDVVHTHGIRPDAYIFFHNNAIHKAKTVSTLHNYVKDDLRYQYNLLISFIFSRLWNIFTSKHKKIVVLSNDAQKYYKKFWMNQKISVVYNGISPVHKQSCFNEDVRKKIAYAKGDNAIVIGAIGLLTARKGFDQLINVLPLDKRFHLVLIGSGKEMGNLKNLAKDLKVETQVTFLGYQNEANQYLDLFDIVAIPSRSEGFPIALLEACSQKKAIVCSDIPIFQEVFSSNEVSFFKLNDSSSLLQSLHRAVENRLELQKNSYSKFMKNYTSELMAQKYIDLYEEK
ncbi:MAG: glycosyltransferase family 4 protein [Campylobacterales bacterium]|nr:glycosyltransferase family 4 protein [Campylobacterales bacterium]